MPALLAGTLTSCLFEDLAVNLILESSSGLIQVAEDFVKENLDVERTVFFTFHISRTNLDRLWS